MNPKTKNTLILVFAGVIAALILFTCNCRKVEKPVIIPVKEQVKAVEKFEEQINPVIDSLKTANKKLVEDTARLYKGVKFYQSENKRIGAIALRAVTIDPPIEGNDYYTTQNAVTDLIENNLIADSICNETITNLQSQISYQAHIVDLKDSLYFQLRQSFNNALDQQHLLAGYNKKLERKVKWTQLGKWGWKAAAVTGAVLILKAAIK